MQLWNAIFVHFNGLAEMIGQNGRNRSHISFPVEATNLGSLYVVYRASGGVTTIEVNCTEGEVAFYPFVSGIMVFSEPAVEKLSSEKLKTCLST